MAKITKEAALRYHESGRPGKIEVKPTKDHRTQTDLSLAYSPGVAYPCLEIQNNPADAYRYTDKGNLVAVISNGTAVLGLGDIGAMSGKPVMEGKGLLFKIYGGLDVFDIEVDETDPDKFCEVVEKIAPTFGGINLEDIKAPECFFIEERLKRNLNIPVMHDDQHGTAIISSAGLMNALEVIGKKIDEIKIVVNGAGAAAISCTKLYLAFGAKKENVVMLDSKGVIAKDRPGLSGAKLDFATDRTDIHTLEEAIEGADVFLGLSKGNVLSKEMAKKMAKDPIIFALANPDPEITYEDARDARPDALIATGRSDYPNQINNVIGFPYIFRGALDVNASAINEEMKMAAAKAIAAIAKMPVPDIVSDIYKNEDLNFGRNYFIPKPIDPRLITEVSCAVAKAAIESGVARKSITDWKSYKNKLRRILGQENILTQKYYENARRHRKKVVFAEGMNPTMLKAACASRDEGVCKPIVLGLEEVITKMASDMELNLEGITIVDYRHDCERERRLKYADIFARKHQRDGLTSDESKSLMYNHIYFGMMMVEAGDADAFITGLQSRHSNTLKIAEEVIGVEPGFTTFGTMHIVNSKDGMYFIGDTLVNSSPDSEELVQLTRLMDRQVRLFHTEPHIALVSHSNFGSSDSEESARVHEAVSMLHEKHPEIIADGEIQIRFALDKETRDENWPFSKLFGHDVNTFVFPNLTSARTSYKMLQAVDSETVVIGPIQMGLNKAIHFVDFDSTVKEIVNVVVAAAVDAQLRQK